MSFLGVVVLPEFLSRRFAFVFAIFLVLFSLMKIKYSKFPIWWFARKNRNKEGCANEGSSTVSVSLNCGNTLRYHLLHMGAHLRTNTHTHLHLLLLALYLLQSIKFCITFFSVCVHRHKRKTNELLWSIFLPPSEVGYGNFAGLFLLDPVVARALGFRKLHNITVAGRRSWSYCWAKDTRTLTANGGGLARFLCECVREQNERIGCLISHVGVITLSRWWWFKVKYIGLVSLTTDYNYDQLDGCRGYRGEEGGLMGPSKAQRID